MNNKTDCPLVIDFNPKTGQVFGGPKCLTEESIEKEQLEIHQNSLDLNPNPSAGASNTAIDGGGDGNTIGIMTHLLAASNNALPASNISLPPKEMSINDAYNICFFSDEAIKQQSSVVPIIGDKVIQGINCTQHADAFEELRYSRLSFTAKITEKTEKFIDNAGSSIDRIGRSLGESISEIYLSTILAPLSGAMEIDEAKKILDDPSATEESKKEAEKDLAFGLTGFLPGGRIIRQAFSKKKRSGADDSPCGNKSLLASADHINSQDLKLGIEKSSNTIYSPINVITGNKVLKDEEDSFLLGKLPITIDRSYDSDIEESSIFGKGWVFAYNLTLEEKDSSLIYTTRHGRIVEVDNDYELEETIFVVNENFWFQKEDQHRYTLWNMSGTYFHFERCDLERTIFRLKAITNKQGAHLLLSYDIINSDIQPIPQLTKIIDQLSGDTTLLDYVVVDLKQGSELRLNTISHYYSITGEKELITTYRYSADGQLSQVINSENQAEREFFYDSMGLMVKHRNLAGFTPEYQWQLFDDGYRVVQYIDNRGNKASFEYAVDQCYTEIINQDGLMTRYEYNEDGVITRLIDFDKSEYCYRYNDNGHLIYIKTPQGLTYQFELDELNRVSKIEEEGFDPVLDESKTRIYEFSYFRDTFNVSRYQDAEGHFWNTGYGASDQVVSETMPQGEETRYYYNQQHDLVKRIDANHNEFLYKWNKRGQLTRKIDCSGHKTHYEYDAKGLLTKATDAMGAVTQYQYDALNRLTKVIDPENQVEEIHYNRAGAVALFIDKKGQQVAYQYDHTGQLVAIKDRLNRTIHYDYDPAGNLLALTNQNGAQYRFHYDAVGRLLKEERIDDTSLEYHYQNGLLTQVDHIGNSGAVRSTKLTFNAWNELLIKESDDHQSHYRYDNNGALVEAYRAFKSMADHQIHPLQFEYNANGQLISERSPDGALFYIHDALGNLQDVTLPNGDKIDYLRYGSGYVHGILWNRDEIINFEHNARHQETLRTLGTRQLSTEYDLLGRVSGQRYEDLSPAHPLEGAVNPQTKRSNLQRGFSYSALDELLELTDSLKGNRRYEYDAEGRLTTYHSAIFPSVPSSGDFESFSYDDADNILNHHPTSLSAHHKTIRSNRINDYNGELYTYDEWGNLLSIYNQQKRRGFKFNSEGVLKSSSGEYAGKYYSAEYQYDALGRRIHKSVNLYEDPELEKLKTETTTHFIWMGMQMIEEREYRKNGMTAALAADLIDRNINPDIYQIPPEESIYRYIYRPDGSYEPLAQIRQLTALEIAEKKKADITTWQQVPDLDKVLAKAKEKAQNGNGSGTKDTIPTYEVRYYQNFINGAPEELVDNAGNILWAENPTAWGKDRYDIETTSQGTHQPLRYQGQYRDTETGLHYNTFRYYNPHCGRFISQDPIGLNGGINLYQYAPNPISWIDPWGLTCAEIDEGKFDYFFGRVDSSPHNRARSRQMADTMKKLGVPDTPGGHKMLSDHLKEAAFNSNNVANTFTKVIDGKNVEFLVKESLFAGPSGKFSLFQSTWEVMSNGTLRLTTMIPKL